MGEFEPAKRNGGKEIVAEFEGAHVALIRRSRGGSDRFVCFEITQDPITVTKEEMQVLAVRWCLAPGMLTPRAFKK